ncbi:MAG: carboxypeptidase regulatory-like domain-containing protein [Chloroflexi bacterium]|nr:MAG: carboxypeptidase regulatory-like domain-containing protein [Chloroflexota bacterium]
MLAAFAVMVSLALPHGAAAQSSPPSQAGTIVSGSVPPDGGFGLIVYGGGTYSQLVTASGCPAARAVFWVTQGGTFLVYVPTTAVGAVNAGFQAAFPNDSIPANTALIGRCTPAAESGIDGLVTVGPSCGPVAMPQQGGALLPCPDKPYQATLVFLDSQGREQARVTTGTDGRYRVTLAAGRYTVLPLNPPGQQFPRASTTEATVTSGSFTTVNVSYDSGIRTAQ